MGAALHLAPVELTPPGPKRKRGGGGGGTDGYDKIVARVYRDPRQNPKSRELILLTAWLICRDPARHTDIGETTNVWDRANQILGIDASRKTPPRLADLIASDVPRYAIDYHAPENQGRGCQAPMIRREGECGKPGSDSFSRVDRDTGWRTPVWYCNRHRAWGEQQRRIAREQPKVEPIPNLGGLMPCYFRMADESWINIYRWALGWHYTRDWEPPSYGLRADEWPAPGGEPAVVVGGEQPRLRLAALDGELLTNP
jgi:hypothetical protein